MLLSALLNLAVNKYIVNLGLFGVHIPKKNGQLTNVKLRHIKSEIKCTNLTIDNVVSEPCFHS